VYQLRIYSHYVRVGKFVTDTVLTESGVDLLDSILGYLFRIRATKVPWLGGNARNPEANNLDHVKGFIDEGTSQKIFHQLAVPIVLASPPVVGVAQQNENPKFLAEDFHQAFVRVLNRLMLLVIFWVAKRFTRYVDDLNA
jgi:hypothetical protein